MGQTEEIKTHADRLCSKCGSKGYKEFCNVCFMTIFMHEKEIKVRGLDRSIASVHVKEKQRSEKG